MDTYKVIPSLQSGVTNYPSTQKAFAQSLTKVLNQQASKGFEYVGHINHHVGSSGNKQFLIFRTQIN